MKKKTLISLLILLVFNSHLFSQTFIKTKKSKSKGWEKALVIDIMPPETKGYLTWTGNINNNNYAEGKGELTYWLSIDNEKEPNIAKRYTDCEMHDGKFIKVKHLDDISGGYTYSGNLNSIGMPNGKGEMSWNTPPNKQYVGSFENALPHGAGKEYFENGDSCVGYWEKGKKHGQFTLYYPKNPQLTRIKTEYINGVSPEKEFFEHKISSISDAATFAKKYPTSDYANQVIKLVLSSDKMFANNNKTTKREALNTLYTTYTNQESSKDLHPYLVRYASNYYNFYQLKHKYPEVILEDEEEIVYAHVSREHIFKNCLFFISTYGLKSQYGNKVCQIAIRSTSYKKEIEQILAKYPDMNFNVRQEGIEKLISLCREDKTCLSNILTTHTEMKSSLKQKCIKELVSSCKGNIPCLADITNEYPSLSIEAEKKAYSTASTSGENSWSVYLDNFPNGVHYAEVERWYEASKKTRIELEKVRQRRAELRNPDNWEEGTELCLKYTYNTKKGNYGMGGIFGHTTYEHETSFKIVIDKWNSSRTKFRYVVMDRGENSAYELGGVKLKDGSWSSPSFGWISCD